MSSREKFPNDLHKYLKITPQNKERIKMTNKFEILFRAFLHFFVSSFYLGFFSEKSRIFVNKSETFSVEFANKII
jgi:hypothetical protein